MIVNRSSRGRIVPQPIPATSVPEYGNNANRVQTITIPLDNARDKVPLEIGGNFLWCEAASSRAATLSIALNDPRNDNITMKEGKLIAGLEFSRLFLTNTAQAGESVTLFVLVEQEDNIRIENPRALLSSIDSITDPVGLESVDLGESTHFHSDALATLITVVAPGSNVAGVDVYSVHALKSTSGNLRIMSDTVAPATWDDTTASTLALFKGGSGSFSAVFARPVRLPIGYGLYHQASNATQREAAINYTVLS